MSEADRLIAEAIRVLAEANDVAAATRAEADRYARRRRSEADLVLAKAQRVLLAAEAKAAVIVRVAGAHHAGPDEVIDLDALAAEVPEPAPARLPSEPTSDLDRLIEAAIGRAVNHAFPVDATR
ncbi:MAG: hypothetical protein ACT452_04840 [Microthrixaceae bacterium]